MNKSKFVSTVILSLAFAGAILTVETGCQSVTSAQATAITTDISNALYGVEAVGQAYVGTVLTAEAQAAILKGAGTDPTAQALAATIAPLIPQVGQTVTQTAINAINAAAKNALASAFKTAVSGTAG